MASLPYLALADPYDAGRLARGRMKILGSRALLGSLALGLLALVGFRSAWNAADPLLSFLIAGSHSSSSRSALTRRWAPAAPVARHEARSRPLAATPRESADPLVPATLPASFLRREALMASTALGVGLIFGERPARAEEPATFCGTAYPPGTYGQFDPDACSKAVYTFEYPADWKLDPPSKSEKGTKFIDGRVINPTVPKKGEQAYVIVLSRAGEDSQSFKLKDTEQTFAGFAIADPKIQDALEQAEEQIQTTRDQDGLTFYDYEIKGPELTYLASITQRRGYLYALFVKAPAEKMETDGAALKNCIKTFKLTGRVPG